MPQLVGFDDHHAGVFIGATIHDVAQVVGAGYAISPEAGDTATVVKLMRVAMLLPVIVAVGFGRPFEACHGEGERPPLLPWFVAAFARAGRRQQPVAVPDFVREAGNTASRWCLVAAIAALGMKTQFRRNRRDRLEAGRADGPRDPVHRRRRAGCRLGRLGLSALDDVTVLFVPGLRDHVADHWQTLLAAEIPGSVTVEPLTEDRLSRAARVAALDAALSRIEGDVVIAAHSAGALMVANWALAPTRRIRGALLATPADVENPLPPGYPAYDDLQANGWLPIPRKPLPFPAIVAASSNDPLAQFEKIAGLARCLGRATS